MSAISPRDLLAQARDLATRDPLKPKQASLRRAVSTAYYALFHLLVTAASQSLGRGSAPLSRLLARAFDHSEMEKACGTFAAGGATPQAVTGAYGPIVVPAELRRVAQAFRDLQEARHDADYGTDRVWTKTEAITDGRACRASLPGLERNPSSCRSGTCRPPVPRVARLPEKAPGQVGLARALGTVWARFTRPERAPTSFLGLSGPLFSRRSAIPRN